MGDRSQIQAPVLHLLAAKAKSTSLASTLSAVEADFGAAVKVLSANGSSLVRDVVARDPPRLSVTVWPEVTAGDILQGMQVPLGSSTHHIVGDRAIPFWNQ